MSSVREMTFELLIRTVQTHEDGLNFLVQRSLIRPPVTCECGTSLCRCADTRTRDGFYMRCPACKQSYSIREKSWFKSVKTPLDTMIKLIYFWCNQFTTKQAVHELSLSKPTVTDYYNMFREICFLEYNTGSKIGGAGKIVQIDESHLFTRKYNVGRVLRSEQCWIFGGIDEDGRIFMQRVVSRSAEVLTGVLMEKVEEGSIIFSDSWRGYDRLVQHFEHHQVNHSENFVNPIDGTNTQKIEASWSVLKRLLRKKGTRKVDNVDFYLAEFMFIMHNKNSPFDSFLSLMKKHF